MIKKVTTTRISFKNHSNTDDNIDKCSECHRCRGKAAGSGTYQRDEGSRDGGPQCSNGSMMTRGRQDKMRAVRMRLEQVCKYGRIPSNSRRFFIHVLNKRRYNVDWHVPPATILACKR